MCRCPAALLTVLPLIVVTLNNIISQHSRSVSLLVCTAGFMSNRGRQNVASYLALDLGIDWRLGADWFETLLQDYDVCSNWCNWVSAAGMTGGRINHFNITKQSKACLLHCCRSFLPTHACALSLASTAGNTCLPSSLRSSHTAGRQVARMSRFLHAVNGVLCGDGGRCCMAVMCHC